MENSLITKRFDKRFKGITFEEYLEKRKKERNPIVDEILNYVENNVENDLISKNQLQYDDYVDYILNSKETIDSDGEEIKKLWKFIETDLPNYTLIEIEKLNNDYLLSFISILFNFNVNKQTSLIYIELIYNKINHNYFTNFMKRSIKANEVKYLAYWLDKYADYCGILKVGIETSHSTYIRKVIENSPQEFESLKTLEPENYLHFIETFKLYYSFNEADYKAKNRGFYLNKSLEQIIVARNNGFYTSYYKLLEDYYTEKYWNQKWVNFVYKYSMGYGEKPLNLLSVFFGVNIVFALIFIWFNIPFNSLTNENCVIHKFFTLMYFNNTTMLTIGYGDIYPTTMMGRFLSALLQILGFSISSATVVLFVRKFLRY